MAIQLPCRCGQTVPVSVAMAGLSLKCACGQIVIVPSYRELRDLASVDEDLCDHAEESLRRGAFRREIEEDLVEQGLDPEKASEVVKSLDAARLQSQQASGQKYLLQGGLWCTGGIVVTVISFASADQGGTFIFAWGAIIVGVIQLVRGLNLYMSE